MMRATSFGLATHRVHSNDGAVACTMVQRNPLSDGRYTVDVWEALMQPEMAWLEA